MTKNMYTVAGDGPCNEELALRMQVGDKNAAGQLVSQNEGYLTDLARAYTPWCEMEDLKQEAALALLDAAERSDPAYGTKLLTYATPAIEAALSDYAARYAFPLPVPTSRGSQLRTVAYFCAEAQDTSEAELTKAVCEKLKVSSKAAEVLLKEYHALCRARQLGDAVFSVSCGGDPAVAYDRLMRRTLLMQRMEEVLTPRELNLVRSYLGIGQPDEAGMTFQELAIYLNDNGPSGATPRNCRSIRSPSNSSVPPPSIRLMANVDTEGTNTMVMPDSTPGRLRGRMTLRNTVTVLAPRSRAASRRE